jgi:cytochrome c oxidase assembly factor CtaG
VTSPQTKTATPFRPRRAALNWVDYLVIAATALIFVGVLAVNSTHAVRAESVSSIIPASELPSQDAQRADRAGLIRARIGLALAGR